MQYVISGGVCIFGASLSEPHMDGISAIFHWGERSEAPHGRYIWDFPYIIGASAAKPHMDDTSGIFHILYIDVRRTALILRCGAQRVHLLRMLIVV